METPAWLGVPLLACLVAALPAQAESKEASPPAFDAGLTCVLQVKDLAKAVEWYRDNMRFAVDWRDDRMGFAELKTPVAGVRIGLARQMEPATEGGALLTFGVTDLGAAERWFASREIETDPIVTYPGLVHLMTLRDLDGNLLQLYQPLKAPPPEHAGLEQVAFLGGSWVHEDGDNSLEEHWTAPHGGLMVGMSRVVRGGKAVFYEHLRIERRGEDIVYVASPGGREPTEFTFDPKQSSERRAVFTNPEHDFPKRITYRLDDAGDLHARIDDGTDEGKRQDFHWKRGEL